MAVIGGQQPGELALMLHVSDVATAARFYSQVFGATEIRKHLTENLREVPDGTLRAVEMRLGNIVVNVVMQNPRFHDGKWLDGRRTDWPRSPATAGTTTATFALYVDDVDAVLAKAIGSGATLMHASDTIQDTPWGDRLIQFFDPMGHVWCVMTRRADVAFDDVPARRAA